MGSEDWNKDGGKTEDKDNPMNDCGFAKIHDGSMAFNNAPMIFKQKRLNDKKCKGKHQPE